MTIRTMSDYCREAFGGKVYRLSLSTGCSCPNRDGTAGWGGCSFCSEAGAGEFTARTQDINRQIEEARARIEQKFPKTVRREDQRYIAYFQSFTNTYGDTKRLAALFSDAIGHDQVVALAIGTRPDCLAPDMLDVLEGLNAIKPVWVELGLQTIHEATARAFNRGYSLDVFAQAYHALKSRGLSVIVHVILGLPGESREDIYETVRYLAGLTPVLDGIKLHGLQILRGTAMAKEYERGHFPVMTLEEYTEVVVNCLKLLPPEVVIHRMTGDGDKRKLIAPEWSRNKKHVLNTLNRAIREAKR